MANESISNAAAQAIEHHATGRFDLAEAGYHEALVLNADEGDALHGLGILEWQTGRVDAALVHLQQARTAHPGIWRYACTLGRLLVSLGKPIEAVAAFGHAARLHADSADLWFDLGSAHHALGQLDQAIPAYRQAAAIQPGKIDVLNNLGVALLATGQASEATEVLRQSLRLESGSAELWFNYANALAAASAGTETVEAYRQALALDPLHAKAWVNLGNTLRLRGELPEALDCYRHAIRYQTDFADAHNNAGVVLNSMGRIDEAIVSVETAIRLAPASSVAYNNLGNALKNAARMQDAIACYRRAVALDASNIEAHANLVYAMSFDAGSDDADILVEARRFAAAHPAPNGVVHGPHGNRRIPDKRLRIGYVSPDFRTHCQSLFTLPLLAHHDHAQYEIHCYADLPQADSVSERLRQYADVWRPTYGMDDDRLAAQIRADEIDILVDLTMHMSNGRPLLFARKPAPIQVAWLAYPGTTGLPAIDYRLTDPWLDPPGTDGHYSETSLRLPDTFWCYDPRGDASGAPRVNDLQPNALPATSAGHVTFGCLNNFCKVSDETLHRWGRVMAGVPASRLILLAHEGNHRQHVLRLLGQQGVDAARIDFVPYRPRHEYLQTYHRIDLCLDTLPYNGHTTSLDAYWMGVPVVTQVGATIAGRAGWSQLNTLGLRELAAFDETGFVEIAVALANDLARLAQLRQSLRHRLEHSPLMDAGRFARAMEDAFREMWTRYCSAAPEA